MAATIRIKREDAIKALQDRLATVLNENIKAQQEKEKYKQDKQYYVMRLKELVVQQIMKDPSALLLDAWIIPTGDYDPYVNSRRTSPAIRADIDTKGIKNLPQYPKDPKAKEQSTKELERQIRLLELATDDTVPVSLFKDLQDLL